MPNDPFQKPHRQTRFANRREFLRRTGGGFGMLALAGLLGQEGLLAPSVSRASEIAAPMAPKLPHFAAKAKSVIWLFMEGGPSGFDLFDPKPELQKRSGQRVSNIQTFFGNPGPLLRSPYGFKQYGQSGAWVCEKYPNIAKCVDDIAFIKSLHTDSNNHAPAMFQMNTGSTRPGLPSAGAWVTYGLGSANQNLPGFVVIAPGIAKGGALNWGNGFLPSAFQGTLLRTKGQAILNLDRPAGVDAARQRRMLDLAGTLNHAHLDQHPGEQELLGRIETFELAYRMQAEAPGAIDLSGESEATKNLYGIGQGKSDEFGRKCLMARRLAERGVRFIQVYSNDEWDAHGDIESNHTARCRETDIPIFGLLTDLKQRGLLDETLVIWGGEFGRMPVSEGGKGRDHNPHGFLSWMAGGGIKGGASHGQTDEVGYAAVQNPVSVPDFHATILHLLGIQHDRLTFEHNGRMFRLTDVSGNVIKPILA
ncbi:MAG TPA: DUF1501 domain-containing protein [Tepidisphaeraceae bacterium]|nr:DUF1501 domain-containing protein [Tepidisphaeraceae bacterium]